METQEVCDARRQVQKNLKELREGLDKLQQLLHPIQAKHSQFVWGAEDDLEERVRASEQVYKHPSYRQTSSKILNTIPSTQKVLEQVETFLQEEEDEAAVVEQASKAKLPPSSSSSSLHVPRDAVDFAFHPTPDWPLPKSEYQESFSTLPILPFPSMKMKTRRHEEQEQQEQEKPHCSRPLCTSTDTLSPSDIQAIIDRERVRLHADRKSVQASIEEEGEEEDSWSQLDSFSDSLDSLLDQLEDQEEEEEQSASGEDSGSWVVVDQLPRRGGRKKEEASFSFSKPQSRSSSSSSSSSIASSHRFKPSTEAAMKQRSPVQQNQTEDEGSPSPLSPKPAPAILPHQDQRDQDEQDDQHSAARRPRYTPSSSTRRRKSSSGHRPLFPSWEERLFNPLLLNPRWPEETDFRRGRWQTEYSASYSQKKK